MQLQKAAALMSRDLGAGGGWWWGGDVMNTAGHGLDALRHNGVHSLLLKPLRLIPACGMHKLIQKQLMTADCPPPQLHPTPPHPGFTPRAVRASRMTHSYLFHPSPAPAAHRVKRSAPGCSVSVSGDPGEGFLRINVLL